MELFEALLSTHRDGADGEVGEVPGLQPRHHVAVQHEAAEAAGAAQGGAGHNPQPVVGQVQQREAEACGIELQTKDKEKAPTASPLHTQYPISHLFRLELCPNNVLNVFNQEKAPVVIVKSSRTFV